MQIINLYALADWQTIPPKQGLVFDHGPDTVRNVRVLLNLETVTSLYIEPEDAKTEPFFLVTAGPGLVRIDFDAVGKFSLFADEQAGVVQFQSTEFIDAHLEPVDEGSFTEIVQRRAVDPVFEEMWYRAQQNMDKRMAHMNAQHQQQIAALIAKGEENNDDTGETAGAAGDEVGNEGDGGAGAQASGDAAAS